MLFRSQTAVRKIRDQDHGLADILDRQLIERARPLLEAPVPRPTSPTGLTRPTESVEAAFPIRNSDRATGAMLSYHIAKQYGLKGLPDDSIRIHFTGSAGQSFGAFLARGVTLDLEGDTNDYCGKGLSGGRIIVRPPKGATFVPQDNIIIGNTVLYGATSGELFACGVAGERFAVRNSGARAVVEGLGDHGCEYMTGGLVVCLGRTGRNFAAGMSGGFAYVLDADQLFDTRCNLDMVDLSPVLALADQRELKSQIERHVEYTGSPLGRSILNEWEDALPCFVKVVPIDYRQALDRMRQQEAVDADTMSSTEEVYSHV